MALRGSEPIVFFDNTGFFDLNLNESEVRIHTSYPGVISGVCSLEIVTNNYIIEKPISNLLDQIDLTNLYDNSVSNAYQLISETIIRIPMTPETFVDGVILEAKNGFSLKQAIEKTLGLNRKVIVRPRAC